MLETIKKSFLSWIVISRTIIISLLWFTVYAWSFDWLTSMSQTWYNLVNLKLNWVYTSWKMCTSDASWQIHCITDIPSWNVPTWAVMAFNWTTCPTWWTIADWSWDEKNTAWVNTSLDLRWDFIRWLDSWRWADPWRTLWSWQNHSLQQHDHYMNWQWWWNDNVVAFQDTNPDRTYGNWWSPWTRWDVYIYVGWIKSWNQSIETRPRNVALLYCVKL